MADRPDAPVLVTEGEKAADAESVKVLRLDRLPEQLPPKGDAADVAGWTPDTGAALLADVNAWQEIQKPTE